MVGEDLEVEEPCQCPPVPHKAWSEHRELVEVDFDADEESPDEETFTEKDSWNDAKLADVCDWLGLPVNQLACRVAFAEWEI